MEWVIVGGAVVLVFTVIWVTNWRQLVHGEPERPEDVGPDRIDVND